MAGRLSRLAVLLAGVAALGATPVLAQPKLLVNTNDAGKYVYGGLHYGGGQWTNVTAAINRTFTGGITTVGTLTNLSQMLAHDALWVDQRWQASASVEEIGNLLAFASTGRRVVVMGENATWGSWNSQILGALGGMEGPLGGYRDAGCMYGRVVSVGNNPLTQGVRAIGTTCGGYAIGGTQLFAYNVASLWRTSQNVLTILDGNIFDDIFAAYDATIFRDRVVDWLAAQTQVTSFSATATVAQQSSPNASLPPLPTGGGARVIVNAAPTSVIVNPEPSTVLMLTAGLVAVVVAGSRRRRA